MFGQTRKIVIGGTDEQPTATVTNIDLMEGVTQSFASLLDDKLAVSGLGHTLAMAGGIYGSAVITNRVLSGRFHANPFSVA